MEFIFLVYSIQMCHLMAYCWCISLLLAVLTSPFLSRSLTPNKYFFILFELPLLSRLPRLSLSFLILVFVFPSTHPSLISS